MSEAASPSLLGTAASLVVVLALFVGAAWVARRRMPPGGRANRPHLATIASLSLGTRERVVIVEAAGQWLVLGVAPGSVQPLATLPRPEGAELAPQQHVASAFAQVLARFAGGHAK